MKTKEWICYSLLAIIAILIVVVIVLSFVPKKLSPTISMASSSKSIVDEMPTAQISVSKYEDGKEYSYKMLASDMSSNETIKNDYNSVIKTFNNMSNYSVMQGLFLGLSNADQSITYGKTSSITALHQQTDGYLFEFEWTNKQTLKNVDGTEYKDSNGNNVKFSKLAIFVDDSNEVATYKIYVKTYTLDDTSCYYTYTAYSNVMSMYNLASSFDEANKLQAPLK